MVLRLGLIMGVFLLSTNGYAATGWVVGNNADGYGTILHTTDSGSTWTRQGSAEEIPDVVLGGVCAVNTNIGWVVGDPNSGYGTILHTTDGGNTWKRQGSTEDVPNVSLLEVSAIDANTTWIVGDNGTILHTEDGGDTWIKQTGGTVPVVLLQGLSAIDANTAWVTGVNIDGYGTILHTTDGGNKWKRQGSMEDVPDVHLLGVSAIDANTAWVIGGELTILHTEDGGSSWETQMSEPGVFDANGVSAIDANTAWIAGIYFGPGDKGVILHTEDGGENWTQQTYEPDVSLMGVSFVAAGDTGINHHHSWYECAIATATYGTPMAEEVKTLSQFKDEYLLTNRVGQALVSTYHRLSPPVADFIRDKESLKTIIRVGLKPLVKVSKRLTSK